MVCENEGKWTLVGDAMVFERFRGGLVRGGEVPNLRVGRMRINLSPFNVQLYSVTATGALAMNCHNNDGEWRPGGAGLATRGGGGGIVT